ncbi:hypothetical protein MKZ08_18780 [Viridibacillus sp. FSL R5-0477]|uniref:DUF8042 domain-containing protein n=1 Tax=Viridibacillus arenosi FSL R5-213 TaxID=1227360 RepID=W4F504_9BACL|nr:hypothetical protein [Viridibacillus arenosi]ETT87870.1 hypothetical protein C176_02968 [Viridibacillus arenosi FSL R5-213]OMC89881.1 hypothetical protein BK137_15930 [Viridibacillus arenosi]
MTEIVQEAVESYYEYLKNLPTGCQTIADNFRENKISKALELIIYFTEGANWLAEISESLKNNDISVNLKTEKIHGFLKEVNHGLEIQDYILVADMFEYEIAPFFEELVLIEGQQN